MAISTEIVGRTFGPFVRDYTFKDLEICALGCGARLGRKDRSEYVNEHDAENPRLKVLPIFGVPLTVNEEVTTTLDYGFDYSGSLHYGIDAHFHAPFKMNDHVETYVVQEAIWDRGEGRGSLSKQVGKSYSADGVHLCTVETYDCCIYDGGFGGERPPKDVVEYPDREPDLAYEEVCGYQWPLIYRLMGDWHQQHIDWAYTEQTGLARFHQPRCLHGRHRHAPPHRAAHPRAARAPDAASSAASLLRCCRARALQPRCGRWARARPASAW
ncbi:MAG: 3-alpha,7-alpha,12-alpha-trihydroxy-5-beta-cholest-24-enoyl-CoA hydratase [Adlercreutzia equolifaciens]